MQPAKDFAKKLIRQFEGLRLKAYRCPAGRLTIGYGSTHRVQERMVITKEQAEARLDQEIDQCIQDLKSCIQIELNPNQWAALLSFTHNIGITRMRASTLMKKINAGDLQGAAGEFLRWRFVNGVPISGLLKRRQVEQQLFRMKLKLT